MLQGIFFGGDCKNRVLLAILQSKWNFYEFPVRYGHKKRSTAVLQPLLTLNLIL